MFGKSLILDITTTDKDKLMNVLYLETFARNLIKAIGMEIHQINGTDGILCDKWGATDLPHTFGVSLICFLTTSSLTIHTTNEKMFLDIFSCKNFTDDSVMEVLNSCFNNINIQRILMIGRI
jgi:S-adenosylmethionine/arginine decarboxylase-like enzyme